MAESRKDRVGIRELRQNLSVYVRRVKQGETLTVTERGSPVARLTPLPERQSALDRLVAEGRAAPARGSLLDLGAPPGPVSDELSRALEEQRGERDLL